jgi:hypothetical protein
MGCCCSRAQIAEEESPPPAPPEESPPPAETDEADTASLWPDMIDLAALHGQAASKSGFKAPCTHVPPSKLTKRQCPVAKDLLLGDSQSVTLIDARFKDINSYQVGMEGLSVLTLP